MKTMSRKIRVVITKEIEVEFLPKMFGGYPLDDYLQNFISGLWDVETIDDVFKYAAEMAARHGSGCQHDGIGNLDRRGLKNDGTDSVFNITSNEVETEIIEQ